MWTVMESLNRNVQLENPDGVNYCHGMEKR